MYLIVLIKEDDNKNYNPVVLDPVESDSIAMAILNAMVNQEYPALVYRGQDAQIEQLSQAIKTSKVSVAELDTIVSTFNKLAEGHDCSLVNYKETTLPEVQQNLELFEGLSSIEANKIISAVLEKQEPHTQGNYVFNYDGEKFYHNVLASNTVVSTDPNKILLNNNVGIEDLKHPPSVTKYPKRINPTDDNKKIWQYVYKNHKDLIKSQKTKENEWLTALILYQRTCTKVRINPWASSSKPITHSENAKEIQQKILRDDELIESFIDKSFDILQGNRLASGIGNQRFFKIEKEGDIYYAYLRRRLMLARNVLFFDVLEFLRDNYAFKKAKGIAEKVMTPMFTVQYVEEAENTYYIYTKIKLIHNNVAVLTEEYSGDKAKALKIMFNNWFNQGQFKLFKRNLS